MPRQSTSTKAQEAKACSRLGSLLIVDDEPLVRRAFQDFFSRDWAVMTAEDGQEALHLIRSFTPDVILSDYQMPRIDGVALARAIRSNRHLQHVPFFLVTGADLIETELQRIGVTKLVPKPFRWEILDQEVRSAVLASANP